MGVIKQHYSLMYIWVNYNDLTVTLLQQWLGCKQLSQEETLFQLSEF